MLDDNELKALASPRTRNDCSVRAMAVVTLRPYEEAREALFKYSRSSRPDRPRVTLAGILNAVSDLGFHAEERPIGHAKTIKSCEEWLGPHGVYLISVYAHVAGLRDGVVYDWAAGRHHRVKHIFRITKT